MPQRSASTSGSPSKPLSNSRIRAFQNHVYRHGRETYRDFPWRHNPTAYQVLVSEIMLQQTQALRVAEKYRVFLKHFPSVRSLAEASLADVLVAWQGLGYNRRAKALWEAARQIRTEYGGRVPRDAESLQALPGIGTYTAAAIQAFAFNRPAVLIETNVRTVFLRHFFPDRQGVADAELRPLVEATLDTEQPCAWYTALFDYGAHLKRTVGNDANRSKHAVKQSPFRGSGRELRGIIIRTLAAGPVSITALEKIAKRDRAEVEEKVSALVREGLVARRGTRLSLAA